jgi:hypothetical protein
MTNHLFQRIGQAAEGHESHKLLELRLVGEAVAAIVVPAKGA